MHFKNSILVFSIIILLFSCKNEKKEVVNNDITTEKVVSKRDAIAKMMAKSGSSVEGTVKFKQLNDGAIMYSVSLTGLEPNSIHAIHIHETGDCSSDDGTSAGGHWNPTENDHGHLGHTDEFHLGDIGNLETNAEGKANLTGTTNRWSMQNNEVNSIVGKAIIVHAKEDDFKTQPTGGAGIRIACGVIE